MSRSPDLMRRVGAQVICMAILALSSAGVVAQELGLGRVALTEEIAAWNVDVRPDGQGLPDGSGDAFWGEKIYTDVCAACHGDFGEAVGRFPALAGGEGSLDGDDPVKTIGSYWPYLSTVFDYVRRTMPYGEARQLSNDELYAVTAYILYLNDLADEEFLLSKENFASIKLPNQDNFHLDDRAVSEFPLFSQSACMSDCKSNVEIISRATDLGITPGATQ